MNSHDDIRKQLSAYAGGDLEPTERIRVEEHFAECATCRAELADLQAVLRLMRTTPGSAPPAWLATRIMARVRQQQREKRSWLQRIFFPLHVKLPLEVAALVLVCVSGYYMARTVETELKQPAIQGETPAAFPQTGQPAPPERPPAATPPAPAAGKEPGFETGTPAQPSAPTAADRIAPRHAPEASGKPSPQPGFAPAPPAVKEEHAAPTAEPTYESSRPSPGNQHLEPLGRALPAEEDLKKKARRTDDYNRAASEGLRGAPDTATGVALPRVTIRLNIVSPAAVPGSLREAVIRTGGSVIDDSSARQNTLRARIPAARMGDLLERLERLGTLVEQPRAGDAAGNVEIEIIW